MSYAYIAKELEKYYSMLADNMKRITRRVFLTKTLPILGVIVFGACNPVNIISSPNAERQNPQGCKGGCAGTCTGLCAVECTNACAAACYDSCYDSCKGSCYGSCTTSAIGKDTLEFKR